MSKSAAPHIIDHLITAKYSKQLAPAWIELESGTEIIRSIGGAWQHYFRSLPPQGTELSTSCEVLLGLLPVSDTFELPQIQLIDNQYTDITGLQHDESDWILFCDVTEHTLHMQKHQQVSNELVLLKGQLKRTMQRYIGQEVVERIANGNLQFDMAGERRLITTLFVDIRGFTPFNEKHDAQIVMQTLNDYMDCMLPPILDEAGMIDKIMGDGAMAVFGVLESGADATHNAFNAAKHILKRIKNMNRKRQGQGLEQLGVGIGIATGEAVLGILGSHDRRCFTAIGSHVNLAARLESTARVGEILLDEQSQQILKENFSPTHLDLKGIGKVTAYSYLTPCLIHPKDNPPL